MNSDLVYKKKYLKYKNKYTALQREMNIQEGGVGFGTFTSKNKYGKYLFFIPSSDLYKKLLDKWSIPSSDCLSDGGDIIPRLLGSTSYYIERKKNLLKSNFKIGRLAISKGFTLKNCAGLGDIDIQGIDFSDENDGINSIQSILLAVKNKVPNLNHYFIVDYNSLKYNVISCVLDMPQPSGPLSKPSAPPPYAPPLYVPPPNPYTQGPNPSAQAPPSYVQFANAPFPTAPYNGQ